MTTHEETPTHTNWEITITSPFLRKVGIISAIVVLAIHIFMAFIVAVGNTGVTITGLDQLSFVGIGIMFSLVCLILLRPYVKASAAGVEVRNILNAQFYSWDLIHGLSFPTEAKFARLELPDFEFVPTLALNIYDKETVAKNVEAFRALEDQYMPLD